VSLTKEQLEIRRGRVGSSEIGALLGVSEYGTAMTVFTQKLFPEERTEAHLSWGHDVEKAILAAHQRTEGFLYLESPGTLVHPMNPAVCATPDAFGVRSFSAPKVVLECKNSQSFNAGKWGEPGTDSVPLAYVAQVQFELGISLACGQDVAPVAHLIACIGGAPPVVYPIQFDAELFGRLVETAEKFVRDHLMTGIPPDGWETDPAAAEYLACRYERNNGLLLPATEESRNLAAELRALRLKSKETEAQTETLEAKIKDLIGETDGIEGVATWRRAKDTTGIVTDWQAVAAEAVVSPLIIEKHTRIATTRKGSRRLLLAKEK
jgi:predicted phage-related endonuclease